MSHPTRVRGLKLIKKPPYLAVWVAPHTGAWIETIVIKYWLTVFKVAPHTGAWIETL